ncbi:SH3 domain-containing protein [Glutamicibacter endophyticus]
MSEVDVYRARKRPVRNDGSVASHTHRTTAPLKLRKGAGSHYLVQTALEMHQRLVLLEVRGSWAHVNVDGRLGWVVAIYLEPLPTQAVEEAETDEATAKRPVAPSSRFVQQQPTHQTTARLKLRSGRGTAHQVLCHLEQGTGVKLLEQDGAWAKVQVGQRLGWVASTYLLELPKRPVAGDLIPIPNQRALTTIRLNARRGPGDHHSLIRILQADTAVVVIARQGAWRQIERSGETMWVPASQLRTVY